ncbi:hypothetical protein IWQ62_003939 [Dispira parvispora]|uniref:DSBA-like thioredoxin domain-containing protein n=1 Tax=Dispira parvispora TaxID=1520584 RepID=A0A9W8E162_9FUNG|nr:hypothetical protein IWQ62_003939 [Dispira parvispora]
MAAIRPATVRLQFWFEYNSLYSYLSAVRIYRTLAHQVGQSDHLERPTKTVTSTLPGVLTSTAPLAVAFRPVLLGPIFRHFTGQATGPIFSQVTRLEYSQRDVVRTCQREDIPYHGYPSNPTPGPVNTLLPTRVTTFLMYCLASHGEPDAALDLHHPAGLTDQPVYLTLDKQFLLANWVKSVFQAFFYDGRDISEANVVLNLLQRFASELAPGLSTAPLLRWLVEQPEGQHLSTWITQSPAEFTSALGPSVLRLCQSHPVVKGWVKHQTEQAIRQGVFGAPFFITEDGEHFWGNDRLQEALHWGIANVPVTRAKM